MDLMYNLIILILIFVAIAIAICITIGLFIALPKIVQKRILNFLDNF